MVLTELETLNMALEALREKLVLPKETVILKEDNTPEILMRLFKLWMCSFYVKSKIR